MGEGARFTRVIFAGHRLVVGAWGVTMSSEPVERSPGWFDRAAAGPQTAF
jgi:hypothetical protein